MSVLTHDTKWRLLIGAAPIIGVAFFAWAAAQGEADVARSLTARAILAGVAALGTAVAWWTARQLRSAPTLTVAKVTALALAGQGSGLVALRGRARAMPDAVPLISPDGELCLWFGPGRPSAQCGRASVHPFLLVDDSGECIVLPAGADVTGQGAVPTAAARARRDGEADRPGGLDLHAGERLLRDGDRIQVVGRFVAATRATDALQAQVASLVATASATQPLAIRIGADEGEGGLYGMLAVVDCLVLLVAAALVAWPLLVRA